MDHENGSKTTIRNELIGERIILRRAREGDAEKIFAAALESKEALLEWAHWFHPGYAQEETAQWVGSRDAAWKQGMEYAFIIEDREGAFVGNCGINRIDRLNLFANLGYWVRSSRTGQGLATAATRLLLPFAFGDLGLTRVEIVVAAGNLASRRVAEKTGALREALLRNRLRLHGRSVDAVMFSHVSGHDGAA